MALFFSSSTICSFCWLLASWHCCFSPTRTSASFHTFAAFRVSLSESGQRDRVLDRKTLVARSLLRSFFSAPILHLALQILSSSRFSSDVLLKMASSQNYVLFTLNFNSRFGPYFLNHRNRERKKIPSLFHSDSPEKNELILP